MTYTVPPASLTSSSRALRHKFPKALLSVREAAQMLFDDVEYKGQQRVRNLINSNQLKALRDGKQYFIPRAEILRLWEPTNEEV